MPSPISKQIIMAGDVIIDWNLIFFHRAHDPTSLWNASSPACLCLQSGGALMAAELIQTLYSTNLESTDARVFTPLRLDTPFSTQDQHYNHLYAIWEQMGDKEKKGWRVSQHLGIDLAASGLDLNRTEEPDQVDLVLLDDANLGFRQAPSSWPKAISKPDRCPWILLKISHPVAKVEMLSYLNFHCPERVIAVISADDLRLSNAQVNRGLSWARIAQDTLWELSYNPDLSLLSKCAHGDLLSMARAIVKNGPEKTLTNIPFGRFSKLLTVDRNEIESYRTIAALIQEYISQDTVEEPVSIAAFGAPGSRKSFDIKEIANSLSDRIKEITFNLSRMNTPADLIGALHQVRDEVLRNKIPLVFWDELVRRWQEFLSAGFAIFWLQCTVVRLDSSQ